MSSTDSDAVEKVVGMPSEPVVDMARNKWTASIGISGRHGPDYALHRFPLEIPYYDKDGILHHYLPDFVVKARDGRFYLIETKGTGFGEMESVKLKDKSAQNRCQRVSELTGDEWRYVKVVRDDFEEYKHLRFSQLVQAISPRTLL